jgi:hypothetical protein
VTSSNGGSASSLSYDSTPALLLKPETATNISAQAFGSVLFDVKQSLSAFLLVTILLIPVGLVMRVCDPDAVRLGKLYNEINALLDSDVVEGAKVVPVTTSVTIFRSFLCYRIAYYIWEIDCKRIHRLQFKRTNSGLVMVLVEGLAVAALYGFAHIGGGGSESTWSYAHFLTG